MQKEKKSTSSSFLFRFCCCLVFPLDFYLFLSLSSSRSNPIFPSLLLYFYHSPPFAIHLVSKVSVTLCNAYFVARIKRDCNCNFHVYVNILMRRNFSPYCCVMLILKEVIGCSSRDMWLTTAWCWVKLKAVK